MRVCVIGAGAAGLVSARHVLNRGLDCEVLELAEEVGGTWLYTGDVEVDQYGFPVYSAMYPGLRTNLPKEVMGFPDYPMPMQKKSYITQPEVLAFLNSYCDHFEIRSKIRFNRFVTNIKPAESNYDNKHRWEVTSIDKITKNEIVDVYDSIMVCNGHYNVPKIPDVKGIDKFQGIQSHSHKYRTPDVYRNKRVLVIGAGTSGMDLTSQICKTAEKVCLSHHLKVPIDHLFPKNVELKPDVKTVINGEEIEFKDGTVESFDVIMYCTGYNYDVPFIDPTCEVTITEKHLKPLYKHLIHIEKPTMCFIGIPFQVCAFHMFDLQSRFFANYLTGSINVTKSEMLADRIRDIDLRYSIGYGDAQLHLMGRLQESYYEELSSISGLVPIKKVIVKLRNESIRRLYEDLNHYREDVYDIYDDDTYIKVEKSII